VRLEGPIEKEYYKTVQTWKKSLSSNDEEESKRLLILVEEAFLKYLRTESAAKILSDQMGYFKLSQIGRFHPELKEYYSEYFDCEDKEKEYWERHEGGDFYVVNEDKCACVTDEGKKYFVTIEDMRKNAESD